MQIENFKENIITSKFDTNNAKTNSIVKPASRSDFKNALVKLAPANQIHVQSEMNINMNINTNSNMNYGVF